MSRGNDTMELIAYFFSGSRWVWVTVLIVAGLAIAQRLATALAS
jgi:hypothetical protein